MGTEGRAFSVEAGIPKLKAPNPVERFILSLKSLLLIASDEEKERLRT